MFYFTISQNKHIGVAFKGVQWSVKYYKSHLVLEHWVDGPGGLEGLDVGEIVDPLNEVAKPGELVEDGCCPKHRGLEVV